MEKWKIKLLKIISPLVLTIKFRKQYHESLNSSYSWNEITKILNSEEIRNNFKFKIKFQYPSHILISGQILK